jgi:hypothetical protein
LSQSLKVREIMTITNDLPELCLPTAGDRPGQQSVVEPMKILSLWCLGSKQKSHSSETPQPFAARLFSFSKPTDTVVLLRFLSLTVSESGKCISSRIHPATHATYHLMLFSTGLIFLSSNGRVLHASKLFGRVANQLHWPGPSFGPLSTVWSVDSSLSRYIRT